MFCRNCGCELAEDARFCGSCGTQSQVTEVEKQLEPISSPFLQNDEKQFLMHNEFQLDTANENYKSLAMRALRDDSYESDLKAALYAPSVFLQDPSAFESTFDLIIYHLDEAFRKTDLGKDRRIVSRVAEELFSNHVYVMQYKIEFALAENKKGLIRRIGEFIEAIPSKIDGDVTITLIEVAPDVAQLSCAYFEYLGTKWMIQEKEGYFYNQLANVYQKILDCECFDPSIGLVRNNYLRNKEDILRHVVFQKGLVPAMNLTKFDYADTQMQGSARIITRTLIEKNDWNNLVSFLAIAKEKELVNLFELKKEVLEAYNAYLSVIYLRSNNVFSSGMGLLWKVGLSAVVWLLAFCLIIYHKFVTTNIVWKGFLDAAPKLLSVSISTLILATIVSIGAGVLTFILLIVLGRVRGAFKRSSGRRNITKELQIFEQQL